MKRIAAKTDEYEKDGQTKGKYVDLGVILSNDNGEYILLNPSVNLAGILMQQRILAQKTKKKAGGSVICSIFDNDQDDRRPTQSGGQDSGASQQSQNFDDDIPF